MIVEMMDVESWEQLAANASRQHEQNLVARNSLQRQRATAALNALVNGDTDAVAGIDDELCGLEARIVGHQQTMKLIRVGLDAATVIACADADLIKISETRANAAKRAELASAVDSALESLAVAVTVYLDSLDGSQPHRAAGNLSRAFWWQFSKTRNRPAWWRQCISGLSDAPHSMASVAPLSATTDPALMESDALEQAALKRRAEAVAALNALTPVSGKNRANRKIEAHLEAA